MIPLSKNLSTNLFMLLTTFGIFFLLVSVNKRNFDDNSLNKNMFKHRSASLVQHQAQAPNHVNKGNFVHDIKQQEQEEELVNDVEPLLDEPVHEKKEEVKTEQINAKNALDFYSQLIANPDKYVNQYLDPSNNDFEYRSQLIPLLVSALSTDGNMLELGISEISTQMLDKVSINFKRKLFSVDTDKTVSEKYNSSEFHQVEQVADKNELHKYGLGKLWGLVLVNHQFFAERQEDIKTLANKAKIVVAFDAEKQSESLFKYEGNKVRDNFRYVCKFTLFKTPEKKDYKSTFILSNYVDLEYFNFVFDKIKTSYDKVACALHY